MVAAIAATLLAIFYTEENWRGKRAWENCRRQLEAKGAVLDWAAYIPPTVPDASNIFKAPMMSEWFSRNKNDLKFANNADERTKELRTDMWSGHSPDARVAANRNKSNDVVIAEITIVPPTAKVDSRQGDALVQFADPGTPELIRRLLRERVGPVAGGVLGGAYNYSARPPSQIKPLRLLLAAEPAPDKAQIAAMFPTNTLAPASIHLHPDCHLDLQSGESNTFRVWLNPPPCPAAEFLAGNRTAEKDFELMRQGLARPYARMEGDYEKPVAGPLPDFITLRVVAQTLGERTQCYLLLNQPEAALRELTLLHELRFLMGGKPPGRPITLVAAMINVAIKGLYTGVIADGLRLHAWQEPQLAAIQQQLQEVDLLGPFYISIESERAGICRTLEITKPADLSKLFYLDPAPDDPIWKRLQSARYWASWGPRGWVYENCATLANQSERFLQALDLTNRIINAGQINTASEESQANQKRFSPYKFLAVIALPNYLKATTVTARNQTMANEALVACALERYRLAHQEFPASLAALVPQYLEKVPADLIGGKPLKYRRDGEGRYVLYSVGWNGVDDGGVAGRAIDEGDWVWEGGE